MDTHRLRYFLRIADEGSINRAANTLGIAQPALSRQVRLLEEDLGVTLFRRTARGVQLTEEGERLRATTAAPLRQLELAMRYVGSPLARVERGLHIGLPATATGILASPLLDGLSAAFPRVDFQISVASTDVLVEGMLKGAVDISVIDPVQDGRLFYHDLLVEDLVLVGGRTSDLQPGTAMDFAELARRPLILPASPSGIRTSIENTALRLKHRLQSRFSTDSLQVTKSLIEAGRGYGVLPLSACAAEIDARKLCYAPLRDPSLTRQLGIAVTANLELPRGFATRVGEIIREEAARLVESGGWGARLSPPLSEA
ncbi:LysR family transcriptional regulator [Parafrankia elaeagni]|uniref:LysR family transcriptional regulator n=1 Tax=Parafrankia elaeagni TaxID=222534 RepID=UPI0003785581|nr:LysR family transcriptional regulator [Parafrankia elaeagni]